MDRDERIAYGVRCSWWDSIYETGKLESGIPCCPRCGGVLMEVRDQATWDANVESYAEKENDPEYPKFIAWLRGRCFATLEEAQEAYQREGSANDGP